VWPPESQQAPLLLVTSWWGHAANIPSLPLPLCRGGVVNRCLPTVTQMSLTCPVNESLVMEAIAGSTSAINGSQGYLTGPNYPQLVITPFTEANSTAEIASMYQASSSWAQKCFWRLLQTASTRHMYQPCLQVFSAPVRQQTMPIMLHAPNSQQYPGQVSTAGRVLNAAWTS
jgi:hypothetical protein